MDISDLNCPQYVSFGSDSFLNTLADSSVLSTDSLDITGQNSSNLGSNYSETNITGDQMSDSLQSNDVTSSAFGEFENKNSNEKENFPVIHGKKRSTGIKTMVSKTTIPKPFRFETDSRIKSIPSNCSMYEEKDFASKLRQNTVKNSKIERITKVKPFNLTQQRKRKYVEEAEYVPLAEQIAAIQQKVPERYQTTSQKAVKEFQPPDHWEPPLLKATAPNLQAVKRRRMVTALSKEEQELKEIQSYQFHAKPVDPKIYEEPKYQFKARPIPKDILSGPTGLKEKPVIPITKPKAPAFQIDNRLEKRKELEEERKIHEAEKELQKKDLAKKKQATEAKVPFVPFVPKPTDVKPFSFDQADRERFSRKERKIQEEIENASKPFVFHAQMMPFPEPSALPAVPKKPATQPEPFNFHLPERSSKQNSFSTEENKSFKAQPAIVLKKEPFVPEKPQRQNIKIEEFHLFTDKRASERQHLKEIKDAEECKKERIRKEQKAIEEEQERIELKRLRNEIVHKANPIRMYKPIDVKPSSMPLTQPKSPEFETDKRLQAKHH
ncbi:targeting protein for Xklp2 [Caerostris extrusa]|uniref:Targeting protein for Xklp2 n=1 Tax=Caerostris extrusa TaxID=172846 RepID=A0AAV4XRH9_CAEEX|nr:targeting protein for Xklp2 [Caerostris extrusa]